MTENDHPPPPSDWEKMWAVVWEELTWVLRTFGLVALSLAVGRIVSAATKAIGIDLHLLHEQNWQQALEQARHKQEEEKNGPTT
jgi:hypothetical protein